MKVWIVTNAYLPEKGGLVSYTRNLALTLIKEGIDVEVITSNLKNRNLLENEVIEGINVKRIDYSGVSPIFKIFSPIIYYWRTKKYIKKLNIEKDDIVISRFYTFALALAITHKIRKHIFITPLVASKLQYIAAKESKGLKKIYYYCILPQIAILDRVAIKKSPYIGVLSKSKKTEVEEYYNLQSGKVKILPPGVDTERFRVVSEVEKYQLRERFGYNKNDIIVLCVSRLSSEKNLSIVIESINEFKDKNIKLALVGDGECRKEIERLINKLELNRRVKLWGPRSNVEEFYNMSDIFILPSKYEGFGHVYLEALSCGLPCIAAKSNPPETITASEEIIINERLGHVIKYNSKEEIIKAINDCILDHEKYVLYRRDYIINNFTWKKHYNDIERVLLNDN